MQSSKMTKNTSFPDVNPPFCSKFPALHINHLQHQKASIFGSVAHVHRRYRSVCTSIGFLLVLSFHSAGLSLLVVVAVFLAWLWVCILSHRTWVWGRSSPRTWKHQLQVIGQQCVDLPVTCSKVYNRAQRWLNERSHCFFGMIRMCHSLTVTLFHRLLCQKLVKRALSCNVFKQVCKAQWRSKRCLFAWLQVTDWTSGFNQIHARTPRPQHYASTLPELAASWRMSFSYGGQLDIIQLSIQASTTSAEGRTSSDVA